MSKILLVEDDNNLREIFEMRLKAEGYETVTASDGEEALVVAMKEKPDLIIADVMMPKLSGFEMLETLRAAPDLKDTKVIMMTALGQAEDRARGEKLGVVKYLVKSQVTLEDFVRVTREVMQPKDNQKGNPMDPNSNAAAPTDPTNQTPPADNSGSAAPASDGSNPISEPSSMPGATQQTTSQEQAGVQEQVDNFASSAPAAPASDGSSSDSGSVTASDNATGDVPVAMPPADNSGSAAPASDGSNPPTPPADPTSSAL